MWADAYHRGLVSIGINLVFILSQNNKVWSYRSNKAQSAFVFHSEPQTPFTLYRIESQINSSSPSFIENKEKFLQILEDYRHRLELVSCGGPAKTIELHRSRNKLLARERINLLIDANTAFLELSPMAAFGMHGNQFPSAGIVTGIVLSGGGTTSPTTP